jgi:hypothetical protein
MKGTTGEARPVHEVFIAGERLADGARGVLATVIHEACHALALARGIKDVSRDRRYHNGRFRDLARAFGLTCDKVAVIGWSATSWNEGLDQRFPARVEAVERAITGWREWDAPAPVEAPTSPPEGGNGLDGEGTAPVILVGRMPAGRPGRTAGRLLATCSCGRNLRISAGVLSLGPITCGRCGGEFVARGAP